ncbi:hypothetical protein ACFRFU_51290 [Streptomyces sp. NPDC056704]|uniref:hypothetical protein n=1 Tax=Streptomyces TaxID=1883 RepID=UPI0036CDC02E
MAWREPAGSNEQLTEGWSGRVHPVEREMQRIVEEIAGEGGEGSAGVRLRLGGRLDNTRRRTDKLAPDRRAELAATTAAEPDWRPATGASTSPAACPAGSAVGPAGSS